MPTVSLCQAEPADSGFVFDVMESAMRGPVEQTWGPWDDRWRRRSHDVDDADSRIAGTTPTPAPR